jgi:HEAT repeat protein
VKIVSEQEAAILALTRPLRDQDCEFRIGAARALGDLGPEAKMAVPALTGLLQDTDAEVRDAAAQALETIKNGKKQGGMPEREPPSPGQLPFSPHGGGMGGMM